MLMFKIDGQTIKLTRGDMCTIRISADIKSDEQVIHYVFKPGDILTFGVYGKKKFDIEPFILKDVEVTEATTVAYISLTSDETKIGEISNKVITYWYEVQLNHKQTIIGYDESGQKELLLYPEGVDRL